MFERLLLAIDDSAACDVATAFATAVARRCGAEVHVFHVNEYLVAGRATSFETMDEARQLVTRAVADLANAGIAASGSCQLASCRQVAQCIARIAESRRVDAIILGSHRHRRIGRLFSGQVRDRTTRLVSMPILTAPAPLNPSAWLNGNVQEMVRLFVDRDARVSH